MIADSINAAIEGAAVDWIAKVSEVHSAVARETCDRTHSHTVQVVYSLVKKFSVND